MEQAKLGVHALGATTEGGGNSLDTTMDTTDEHSHQQHSRTYADSPKSGRNSSSVASFASLSHHAKSIVSTFSCTGERELAEHQEQQRRGTTSYGGSGSSGRIKHSSSKVSSPQQILRQRSPFRARR